MRLARISRKLVPFFVFVPLVVATPATSQMSGGTTYRFKQPEASWALTAELPGFVSLDWFWPSDPGEVHFTSADDSTGVVVDVLIADHPQAMSANACRDYYWQKELSTGERRSRVRMSTTHGMPQVEWYNKAWGWLRYPSINQRNVKVFLARDMSCIQVYLFKNRYRKEDEALFEQVLAGLRLVEDSTERPAALPPARSEVTVSPEELVKRLASDDSFVRVSAIGAVIDQPVTETIPSLTRIARRRREYPDFRVAAAKALAGMDSLPADIAVDLLDIIDLLEIDEDMVEELILGVGEAAVPELARCLGHCDSDRRELAAELLGEIGGAAAIRALTAALDDRDDSVRASAIQGLIAIGGPEVMALVRRYASDPILGIFVAEALQEIGGPQSVELLIGVVEREPNTSTRFAAIRALARIGDPRAAEPLAHAVERFPGEQKREPALALAMVGEDGARSLVRLLDHQDQQVRFYAAQGLSLLRGTAIQRIFNYAVRSRNQAVVSGGYLHYLRTGTSEAIELLIAGLPRFGDMRMASYFKGCGQPDLMAAADQWAFARHSPLPLTREAPKWGSEPPGTMPPGQPASPLP